MNKQKYLICSEQGEDRKQTVTNCLIDTLNAVSILLKQGHTIAIKPISNEITTEEIRQR